MVLPNDGGLGTLKAILQHTMYTDYVQALLYLQQVPTTFHQKQGSCLRF